MTRLWLWWHGRHGIVIARHPVPALQGFQDAHGRDYSCECGATRDRA